MKLSQKDWLNIRNVLRDRDIDVSQHKHINCVRMHPTESDAHWNEKQRICRELYKQKHPFITEVWTADHKQRFDILDLSLNRDIEVETGKSKNKKYKGDEVFWTP